MFGECRFKFFLKRKHFFLFKNINHKAYIRLCSLSEFISMYIKKYMKWQTSFRLFYVIIEHSGEFIVVNQNFHIYICTLIYILHNRQGVMYCIYSPENYYYWRGVTLVKRQKFMSTLGKRNAERSSFYATKNPFLTFLDAVTLFSCKTYASIFLSNVNKQTEKQSRPNLRLDGF